MNALTRLSTLCFILISIFYVGTSFTKLKVSTNDTTATLLAPDTAIKRYLALGDSYTIGQSVKVWERYPVQSVAQLRNAGFNIAEAEIIATSGWTTEDLLGAVKEKSSEPTYDMVTLLIGVNDQYQRRSMDEYRAHFTLLIKRAIRFAHNRPSRVIVLSIPDYSVTPFANNSDREAIAREINSFNRANKRISELQHVNYLDITGESRKAAWDRSLIAYDDLHFSGKEYKVWTSMLVPMMSKLLMADHQQLNAEH